MSVLGIVLSPLKLIGFHSSTVNHRWSSCRGREQSTRHDVAAGTALLRLETARFGRSSLVMLVARLRHGELSTSMARRKASWWLFATSLV